MEHEKGSQFHPVLTPDEVEFLRAMKRDYDKSLWLKVSGAFTLVLGVGIGAGTYLTGASDTYLMIGGFFLCIGIITLRDTLRTKRLYEILKKFMPSNMEM